MNQIAAIALLLVFTLATSCEKEQNDEQVPQLPPLSSFLIDMDDLTNLKKSTGTYENVTVAVLSLWYWNSLLTVGLAVPVATYVEAFNHDPVRVDNDTWKWTYDVIVQEVTYTAELTADVVEDIVNLEMRISQEEGFQDFLWYSGSCNILRTTGSWTLYDNPEDQNEFVGIAWNRDWEAETFDVTYTVINPENEYYNSYIEYGITEDPVFNAYYEVYDSAQEYTVTINYNTETHEGNIFNGVDTYCWDENFEDVACL